MAVGALVMGIGTLVRHLIRRNIIRGGANRAGEEKYWRTM
jgi:hypothetical protein